MLNKIALRSFYKKILLDLSEVELARFSEQIAGDFLDLPEYQNASAIMAYVSLPYEVGTRPLIDKMLEDDKKVCVPVVLDNENMDCAQISSLSELTPGKFGILSPSPLSYKKLDKACLDLIIVPALAFDILGNRLGRGGGYYDRFLAEVSAATVGFCPNICLTDSLPRDKTDISVSCVITEQGVLRIDN